MTDLAKLTKAQQRFLAEHLGDGHTRRGVEDGYRPKWLVDRGSPTYDFVGRVRRLGLIEIIPTEFNDWPYAWAGTRITEAGRRALSARSP